MADSQPNHPAPDAGRSNTRTFLAREWPYLLVLILALFGVAYASFAKTPMTAYWVVLAPVIGLICVVTRWGDAETREQLLKGQMVAIEQASIQKKCNIQFHQQVAAAPEQPAPPTQ